MHTAIFAWQLCQCSTLSNNIKISFHCQNFSHATHRLLSDPAKAPNALNYLLQSKWKSLRSQTAGAKTGSTSKCTVRMYKRKCTTERQ